MNSNLSSVHFILFSFRYCYFNALFYIFHLNQILASAIQTCSRNSPNPSECILGVINGLRQRLATGDLGDVKTVALEPLGLDNIHFKRGPEFTASFNNLLVNGPSNFIVSKLKYESHNHKHYSQKQNIFIEINFRLEMFASISGLIFRI